MIMFIVSLVCGVVFIFLVAAICYFSFWIPVNFTRIILFYVFKFDTFTKEEKINLGIIDKESEVEVVNPDSDLPHEEFWERMNAKLDVDLKIFKSKWDDDLHFQAIVKNRKRK